MYVYVNNVNVYKLTCNCVLHFTNNTSLYFFLEAIQYGLKDINRKEKIACF